MRVWTILGVTALTTAALAQTPAGPAAESPAGGLATPATRPATRPAPRAWVNPQPDVPFLPKPPARPADWLVEHPPVSPDASPEAKALLKYLYSISTHHTLTGQHNFADEHDGSTQLAARWSRKQPVIYGIDFGFAAAGDKDSAYVRPRLVEEMTRQWQAGSILAVTWHEVRPIDDEPVTFMGSVRKTLTDAQFDEVLTPGTPLHARWEAKVDEIAGYLKQLEAAHVPVLFRPYHEINGNWFWWNGRRGERGSRAMYRMMFDRMIGHHHLTNLVWVWNVDQPILPDRQFVDYFPGHDEVDVLTLDCYGPFQQRFYDELNALSDGKVMAIGETTVPPTPAVYATQPKWAWYMIWARSPVPRRRPTTRNAAGATASPSTPAAPGAVAMSLAEVVASPRMLSLQDEAYWQGMNPVRHALGLPAGEPYAPPPPYVAAPAPAPTPATVPAARP